MIVEGEMEMVGEKEKDREDDFEKDGIGVYVEGEWVKGKGRRLG